MAALTLRPCNSHSWFRRLAVLPLLIGLGCSAPAGDPPAAAASGSPVAASFDPARDPAKDLEGAIADARRTGRRIVLDVGGEWCSWCHILDKYIEDHADVKATIARDFVWLKINYSPENESRAFLAQYPSIDGYPHLFVLETDGSFLHSQNTADLEDGPSYDLEKVRAFLATWRRL